MTAPQPPDDIDQTELLIAMRKLGQRYARAGLDLPMPLLELFGPWQALEALSAWRVARACPAVRP